MILWAWENPQDLTFIDPDQVGVAFLAKTLTLRDGQAIIRPRFQPLRVPLHTTLIAVVRLESTGRGDLPQPAQVASAISELAQEPGIRAVQLDYDARVSERGFYRHLIGEVKRRLPEHTPLLITALASWCLSDGWIRTLPVSEAVPMLFRMGREHYGPRTDFRVPLCRSSIGVSTDEPPVRLPGGRRVFVFHPGPWTKADYRNVVQEVQRRQ